MEGDECPCVGGFEWKMGLLSERMTAITIPPDQRSSARVSLGFPIASHSLMKEKYSEIIHQTRCGIQPVQEIVPPSLPSM